MNITYNEWGMGYIYLKNVSSRFDSGEVETKKLTYTVDSNDNLSYKLNKLNWSDKKYVKARDEEFIEEFQNDLDDDFYIKGIEFEMKSEEFNNMIDNYQIKSFEFRENHYYCICFSPETEIFDPNNYIYAFSENEDAFAVFKLKEKDSYKIALFKALIFSEDSPYNIEYFKTLKLY
jgi:hypothetical protein